VILAFKVLNLIMWMLRRPDSTDISVRYAAFVKNLFLERVLSIVARVGFMSDQFWKISNLDRLVNIDLYA